MCMIAINLLHNLALYASRPFLALLAQALGAHETQTGVIVALYSLIQVAAALPVARAIVCKGLRRMAGLGAVCFLLGCLLLLQAKMLRMVGFAALWMGLGHSLLLQCGQFWSTGFSAVPKRAQIVGWLSFSTSLGAFLGPSLGGILQDALGIHGGFWGAVVFAAAGLGCVRYLQETQSAGRQNSHDTKQYPMSGMRGEIIRSAVVFFAADILAVYLPLYGVSIGLDMRTAGLLLGLNGLAQMAVRPLLGKLCARWSVHRALCGSLLASGTGIILLGSTEHFLWLAAGSLLTGCAIGLSNPLTLLTVSQAAGEEVRSRALALRVMANYAGQTISPVLFGGLASVAGLAAVFWSSGATLLLCGLSARCDR